MRIKIFKKIATLAFLIVVMMFLQGVKAEEKSAKTSGDESGVKLLYELTFPDCIETYSLEKGEGGELRVGNILTLNEIYKIDKNLDKKIMMKRGSRHISDHVKNTESTNEIVDKKKNKENVKAIKYAECELNYNAFDSQGEHLIELLNCGDECTKVRITNLITKQALVPEDSVFPMAVSENRIFDCDSFTGRSRIIDFSGNIIAELPSIAAAKSHRYGFIGWGWDRKLYFFDSNGSQLNYQLFQYSHINYFDVDYSTGISAVIDLKDSKLLIYDHHGKLLATFNVNFSGHSIGLGVSYGGNFVAVLSHKGWIKVFDIRNKKEFWSKNVDIGNAFLNWRKPVPVSQDGKYCVLNCKKRKSSDDSNMVVLNKSGKVVDSIDPPDAERSYSHYVIQFIQDSRKILAIYDNTIFVFEII